MNKCNVHQQVMNFVCLSFGGAVGLQWLYPSLFTENTWVKMLGRRLMRERSETQPNSKVTGQKTTIS